MNKKKLLIILVIVCVVLLIVFVPIIKENKTYKDAINYSDTYYCNLYIYNYPDGKHIAEVKDHKDEIYYQRVQDDKQEYVCDLYISECPDGKHLEDVRFLKIRYAASPLHAINDYLYEFPDGKYCANVNSICDSLWDVEIAKYNARDKKRESAAAVKYMTEMLQYMKANRINSIFLEVSSHLKLKDYSEYDSETRNMVEILYNSSSLPFESSMVSLNENFSEANVEELKEILSDGVQKSLDNMFTPGFITVMTESSKTLPRIHFDYTIKSQEEKWEGRMIPEIWTYRENGLIKAYLVGISINFKADYSIPGSSTTFSYSAKGEPEKTNIDVENIRDGYRQLTTLCFAQFSNNMSRNMGLKESYF